MGKSSIMPQLLYKYRNWADRNHQRIIRDNCIYFASPNSFPDKVDCRPPYVFPQGVELYKFFYNHYRKLYPLAPDDIIASYANYWKTESPLSKRQERDSLLSDLLDESAKSFGVLSLAKSPTIPKMWEEYANNKGICIALDTQLLQQSTSMMGAEVVYTDKLSPVCFGDDDLFSEIAKSYFQKLTKYSFENEYRLCKRWDHEPTNEERNITMPDGCIIEVILAKDFPESDKAELMEYADKMKFNIKQL